MSARTAETGAGTEKRKTGHADDRGDGKGKRRRNKRSAKRKQHFRPPEFTAVFGDRIGAVASSLPVHACVSAVSAAFVDVHSAVAAALANWDTLNSRSRKLVLESLRDGISETLNALPRDYATDCDVPASTVSQALSDSAPAPLRYSGKNLKSVVIKASLVQCLTASEHEHSCTPAEFEFLRRLQRWEDCCYASSSAARMKPYKPAMRQLVRTQRASLTTRGNG